MLLSILLEKIHYPSDIIKRQGSGRKPLGTLMSPRFQSMLLVVLPYCQNPVVDTNSIQKSVSCFTHIVTMMHEVGRYFAPFSTFVSAIFYTVIIIQCSTHKGPKDYHVQFISCQQGRLCTKCYIMLNREE